MTVPALTQTELDGALGVLPPSAGALLAIIGTSSAGTAAVPATFARSSDVVSAFGYGPLVEAACRHIDTEGKAVVVVKCTGTTAATMGTIDVTKVTGTLGGGGFIIQTTSTFPYDDFDVVIKITAGGTTGTAGIKYVWSLDGGRNFSAEQSLGTSLTLAIPNTGVSFTLTTGKTVAVGDYWSATTTAPAGTSSDLTTALTALAGSSVTWEGVHVASPFDATIFAAWKTAFAALPVGHWWIANTRMPNSGESESTYLSSLSTAFGSLDDKLGSLCAGQAWIVSSVPGRPYTYRRPVSFHVACRNAAVAAHVNIAAVKLGSAIGVRLRDDNGNPVAGLHDEWLNPGLDDARFTTLRTWPGRAGVYVTRPRIFSAAGSDFTLIPLRRVMNRARVTTRSELELLLSADVPVDKRTGFILEAAAREIEAKVNAMLRAALLADPMASDAYIVLRRTDNLLAANAVLLCDTRVVPLAYVQAISESDGFVNPALAA